MLPRKHRGNGVSCKQFPNELFLISIWRSGSGWSGCSASAIPCPDGQHLVVRHGELAGPLAGQEQVLAELQPLAAMRGYRQAEVVIERYQNA
jgi:hypothetical protein